jgi:hypothetical protein
MTRRRRILYGTDLLEGLNISREALLNRLKQVLVNTLVRMRYVYALRNDSPGLLSQSLANSISSLRASACAFLEIRGLPFNDPKHALETVAREARLDGFAETLGLVSETREGRILELNQARQALAEVMELTGRISQLIDAHLK